MPCSDRARDRHISKCYVDPSIFADALAGIRDLSNGHLDTLVRQWLEGLGLHSITAVERSGSFVSYRARTPNTPLTYPTHVWVYRRKNRLQVHHVDACVGWLQRNGVFSGTLVTTGDCSVTARMIAGGLRLPSLRVLTGPEWAKELAELGIALRQRQQPRWLVDLHHLLEGVRRSSKAHQKGCR